VLIGERVQLSAQFIYGYVVLCCVYWL